MFDSVVMRWAKQVVGEDGGQPTLPGMPGLVRTVRTPEFAGVVFHEVLAKSVLNRVPAASRQPFSWTVNPYRGCTHACVYCFARNSHTYLDLDSGLDFDSQVVVKVNTPDVLARELAAPSWTREPVAMGTNTDPYQRAEGRYRLMPGVIDAFVRARTPFSVLTKGTLLARDLPALADAARTVRVGLAVSIAMTSRELSGSVEPGTPSPQARLELVGRITGAGLDCGVMVAPVLPCLTDSIAELDELLGQVAAAGASWTAVLALHLRTGAREWYLNWLARERPDLMPRYRRIYARGAYADKEYRAWLARRVGPLLRKHGLHRSSAR